MGIVLARIDERLVNGIVVTQWTSAVKAKRVYPADNDVLLRPGSRIDKLIQAMNAVFVAVPAA